MSPRDQKPPKLVGNVLALSTFQLVSYALPLLTLPYVTRTLGVDSWGAVALAQASVAYVSLLANWGFNLSATGRISANRSNPYEIERIFSATWCAQGILTLAGSVTLIALTFATPSLRSQQSLLIYALLLVVGNFLTPMWLLAGLEQLKAVAAIQIVARILPLPLIFVFVNSSDDGPTILAIFGAQSILGGALTLAWIFRSLKLKFRPSGPGAIVRAIVDGAPLFGSSVSVSIYTMLPPLLLGALAGPAALGYYALADRIRQTSQSALNPIAQSLFPRMMHLFRTERRAAHSLLAKSGIVTLLFSSLISATLLLFARPLVHLFGGAAFEPAIQILRILSPLPFVVAGSNILGLQVMLPNGRRRAFLLCLVTGSLTCCFLLIPLVKLLDANGAATTMLLCEVMVTVIMLAYVLRTRLLTSRELVG